MPVLLHHCEEEEEEEEEEDASEASIVPSLITNWDCTNRNDKEDLRIVAAARSIPLLAAAGITLQGNGELAANDDNDKDVDEDDDNINRGRWRSCSHPCKC